MRRIATALLAAGALVAGFAMPASAGAAFGPVGVFGSGGGGEGELNHPQGVAATGAQVFVADPGNARVDIFGAGGAFQGVFDTPGITPQDVAVAPSGNIYAASPGRVDAWGLLGLHIAQWSPPGSSYGVAVDPSGNVWVSDVTGNVVRAYTAGGATLVTTIGAGELSNPRGITTDAAGAIYVADTGNGRIVKFGPAGDIQGAWAMPTYTLNAGGQLISGRIQPHDVAVDGAGRVFAPDAGTSSNFVAIFGSDGSLQQLFGSPASDPGNSCPLSGPWGLAVSPAGTLFVASTGENAIRVYNESVDPCPVPDLGPGGGVDASGGGGAGGGGGAIKDTKKPKVKLSGVPKKCPKGDFAFQIHASDDGIISRLTLFVNHKRVARQNPNRQLWNVKVNIPVRKIQRALPRGTFVRVLIQVKVVDSTGKKATISKSFRICG
jgi:streptogramin lyase